MSPYREPAEVPIYIEPLPLRYRVRRVNPMRLLAALGLAVFGMRALVACFPADIRKDTAAGLYEAQQLACVDKYADKPSIDKCRARVKASWAKDAGGDQ